MERERKRLSETQSCDQLQRRLLQLLFLPKAPGNQVTAPVLPVAMSISTTSLSAPIFAMTPIKNGIVAVAGGGSSKTGIANSLVRQSINLSSI